MGVNLILDFNNDVKTVQANIDQFINNPDIKETFK